VKSQRSRSCAAFGSKTPSGSKGSSTGEATTIFLRATSSSTRPMIQRHATARSARRGGLVTSVHLTETCEKQGPHLITHVATTAVTTTDEAMTETIHDELKQTDLTPRQHLLDTGYITAPLLVSSQQRYGIEVIGPGRPDVRMASQHRGRHRCQSVSPRLGPQASDLSPRAYEYELDACSRPWQERGHQDQVLHHRLRQLSSADPLYPLGKKYKRRTLTVRPQAQHEALQAARRRPQTPAFAKEYALREGIEATISESGCVPLACAAPVILALPKRICNILALPRRSMWCAR
jgi:hypothetical protein